MEMMWFWCVFLKLWIKDWKVALVADEDYVCTVAMSFQNIVPILAIYSLHDDADADGDDMDR